jgi:hypothetical protein
MSQIHNQSCQQVSAKGNLRAKRIEGANPEMCNGTEKTRITALLKLEMSGDNWTRRQESSKENQMSDCPKMSKLKERHQRHLHCLPHGLQTRSILIHTIAQTLKRSHTQRTRDCTHILILKH